MIYQILLDSYEHLEKCQDKDDEVRVVIGELVRLSLDPDKCPWPEYGFFYRLTLMAALYKNEKLAKALIARMAVNFREYMKDVCGTDSDKPELIKMYFLEFIKNSVYDKTLDDLIKEVFVIVPA